MWSPKRGRVRRTAQGWMSVLIPVLPPQDSCDSELCSSQCVLDGERVTTTNFFQVGDRICLILAENEGSEQLCRGEEASELQNENFLSQGMATGENGGT